MGSKFGIDIGECQIGTAYAHKNGLPYMQMSHGTAAVVHRVDFLYRLAYTNQLTVLHTHGKKTVISSVQWSILVETVIQRCFNSDHPCTVNCLCFPTVYVDVDIKRLSKTSMRSWLSAYFNSWFSRRFSKLRRQSQNAYESVPTIPFQNTLTLMQILW